MSLRARLASVLAAAVLSVSVIGSASAQMDTEVQAPFSVPPVDINTCPTDHPIKGNKAGRQVNRPVDPIYHMPGTRYYAATDPEECFATATDAEAAGYRAPLR